MARECSNKLKLCSVSQSGSQPVAKIEIYPISGTHGPGYGLRREIRGDILGTEIIWPSDGRESLANICAMNLGNDPPLGIPRYMLIDGFSYQIGMKGYFLFKRPEGAPQNYVTGYEFAYISTGSAFLVVDNEVIADGPSKDALKVSNKKFYRGYEEWVPFTFWFKRGIGNNRRLVEERFCVFWKNDYDNEWRVVGADVTSPFITSYRNIIGNPIVAIAETDNRALNKKYRIVIHLADGFHFHVNDTSEEYPLSPGSTQQYELSSGDIVKITWHGMILHGYSAMIWTDGFAHAYELPSVINCDLDTAVDSGSVLRFTVPVTKVEYDESNITRENAYTYDVNSESFGLIRKNRLVKAYFGYIVNGVPEYVRRFTGFIQDINPRHSISDVGPERVLEVTAIDCRIQATGGPVIKIESTVLEGLPNNIAYDIAQIFPETDNTFGPDGKIRPPAYDRWNLASMIRSVLYLNNFTSSQLWAKDSNGNYLIEDRGLYLEGTLGYPYRYISIYGTRASTKETMIDDPARWSDFTKNLSKRFEGWEPLIKGLLVGFTWIYTIGKTGLEEIRTRSQAIKLWSEFSATEDAPYIYKMEFSDDPWEALVNICNSFGLKLYVNMDGNVVLEYPNNPRVYNTHPMDDYDDNYIEYSGFTRIPSSYIGKANDLLPLRGFVHKADSYATATVHFKGVGLRLLFGRPSGISKVYVKIDGILVNGYNTLDILTGDRGHREWIEHVGYDGVMNLSAGNLNIAEPIWFYQMGLHPMLGHNPSVYTVCDDLTYGEHTAVIYYEQGTVYIEGFMVITKSVEKPEHVFTNVDNILDLVTNDTLDQMTNDVLVIGNSTGVEREYISARATDLASIIDPSSANYVGVRRQWVIITPRVSQASADYLAQYILLSYRKGVREPNILSPGLPWLEPFDCVAISHPDLGYYKDLPAFKDDLFFLRYWVKAVRESYEVSESVKYTANIVLTSVAPIPAYEVPPEPREEDYPYIIANFDLSVEGGGNVYNPYLEDSAGKYVNIEFGLTCHAKSLTVRVITSDMFRLYNKTVINPSAPVVVLLSRSGFISAGSYKIKWDGWVTESDGSGHYAENGDYAIEIEVQKYYSNRVFYFRSDSDLYYSPTLGRSVITTSTSQKYIRISKDDSVYGDPKWEADFYPLGTPKYPVELYDTTNNGNGCEISAELNCPAKVFLSIRVRQFLKFTTPPNDINKGLFQPKAEWHLTIPSEEEAPLLDPGRYTFYFRPVQMLTKDGTNIAFRSLPSGKYKTTDLDEDWWASWHFIVDVRAVDKSGSWGSLGLNYVCWGGEDASIYAPNDKVIRQDEHYSYYWYRIKKKS